MLVELKKNEKCFLKIESETKCFRFIKFPVVSLKTCSALQLSSYFSSLFAVLYLHANSASVKISVQDAGNSR